MTATSPPTSACLRVLRRRAALRPDTHHRDNRVKSGSSAKNPSMNSNVMQRFGGVLTVLHATFWPPAFQSYYRACWTPILAEQLTSGTMAYDPRIRREERGGNNRLVSRARHPLAPRGNFDRSSPGSTPKHCRQRCRDPRG